MVPFCVISSIQSMSLPKMASHSFDPREALLAELREKFPEVFTEGTLDIEKMENFLQCKFSDDKDRYRMTWAGRKEAIQQIQVKTTRTLTPELKQSVNFGTSKNIFIEGDNLEVLRVLQKSYYGKVKMIYIDPPYNTGNDFIYHDDFKQSRASYQQESGMTDEEGNTLRKSGLAKNTKDQGHYHSNWLSMIFPRLYLAKNLLRQDGVIFVSIDDNEASRLRLLMDEVFGEENFISEIVWQKKYAASNDNKYVSDVHEYILVYARGKEIWRPNLFERSMDLNAKYNNPDNDPRGPWYPTNLSVKTFAEKNHYEIVGPTGNKFLPPPSRCWAISYEKYLELLKDNRIWFGKDQKTRPYQKTFLTEVQQGVVPTSLWLHEDAGHNIGAKSEIRHIFSDTTALFDTPKPVKLIKRILQLGTEKDSVILDFFAGSGTTAHAVMQLNAEDGGNRKWICVQLNEVCDQDSEAYKAGYKTIGDIARERIRRAGKKIQEENKGKPLDVGFKAFRLAKSNFPVWRGLVQDEHDLLEQMDLFANAQQHDAEPIDLLYELILKEGLDINIDIQQKEIASGTYYLIDQAKLAISFASPITDKFMDALFSEEPEKIILLESAFIGNDELKMNTVLHAQTLKIDIRVI